MVSKTRDNLTDVNDKTNGSFNTSLNKQRRIMYQVVFCFLALLIHCHAEDYEEQDISLYREEICCDRLGCFNNDPPFNHLEIPVCPENLHISFYHFCRENGENFQRATRDVVPPAFKPDRRTIFVIHGWLGSKDWLSWMSKLRKELLKHGNYNVIVTDWSESSTDVWYPKAATNTRSVGGEVWLVMKNLVEKGGASWNNMYCTGHSLGGHICGFAGKRTNGVLQRITGFDPAGPLFNDSSPATRLHKTDAKFVDVVHSHTRDLVLALGIGRPIGDVDFFPNGIGGQPGCLTLMGGIEDTVTCAHHRSIHYYMESLNSQCKFKSYPCRSMKDVGEGKCNSCTPATCQYIGIESERYPGRGPYYLKTKDEAPFCCNGDNNC